MSAQLQSIHDMLVSTDMVLRPDEQAVKTEAQERMAPYQRMATMGFRGQQDAFVQLMEKELATIVEA